MPRSWRDKYCNTSKGVCDFSENYNFFFKWLTNKLTSCFIIRNAPDTVNTEYLKIHLMLDGYIALTKVEGKLYAVAGAPGGEPDEYYLPTVYTLANPILGSKTLYIRDFKENKQNAVMLTNTAIDRYNAGFWSCGLFDLVHQTATLLADNIVSLSCCQINSRVQTIITAPSDPIAAGAEAVLKRLYAGAPFAVVRENLVNKLQISPIANTQTAQTIGELLELHNYIIANFFKSIGVQANEVRKKERLITGEIEEQVSFVALSLTEILESWLKGFEEANKFFGTKFEIELNPVIVRPLLAAAEIAEEPDQIEAEPAAAITMQEPEAGPDTEPEPQEEAEPEQAETEPAEEPADKLEETAGAVEAVAEFITGEEPEKEEAEEMEEGEEDAAVQPENAEGE